MEIKNYKKEDLFYCYSIHLFHFLKANNFYYLYRGLNTRTEKNYWIFERTPEFLKALTIYTDSKNK